jgi:hypothetical protein
MYCVVPKTGKATTPRTTGKQQKKTNELKSFSKTLMPGQ